MLLKLKSLRKVNKDFFNRDTVDVAKELLGKVIAKGKCAGIIVETEAYKDDPASHAHKITPRSKIMLDTYGHVYVYFIYGNYHCLNFTCEEGKPGAVLIRAIEPISGLNIMKKRRGISDIKNLTNGPGKLCQALNITREDNGKEINKTIHLYQGIKPKAMCRSKRIGIKKGLEYEWRFYIKDNPFVSR